MTNLNDFFHTDNVDFVLAAHVNNLLASTLRAEYSNAETLIATRNLLNVDVPIQRFVASGENRTVNLPLPGIDNHLFLIINAGSSNNLLVGGLTELLPGMSALFASDGTAWRLAQREDATVTQAEAEAGTSTTRRAWTAERVRQAARASTPAGVMQMFAGASAPDGWLICNGSAIARASFPALFAAIGVAYGAGDGSTTFNIPDLRGRTPIGAGQGTGLTNRTLAQMVGAETHTLAVEQMPIHTHVQNPHTHIQNPHDHEMFSGGRYITGIVGTGGIGAAPSSGGGILSLLTGQATPVNQNATAINQNEGNNAPHNNMQPSIVLNYIIKT